jgi:hypothetical protein
MRRVLAAGLMIGCAGCGSADSSSSSSIERVSGSAATSSSPTPPPLVGRWLGLDYNSSTGVGGIDDFAARGVVYDRSGRLETDAGQTAGDGSALARGVSRSIAAGMAADVEVDPATGPLGCAGNPNTTTLCLPRDQADVRAYVRGFVATASSIKRRYPHWPFVFEPMDEPWNWPSPPGTTSGRAAAQEYAAVLAQLLPAAAAAGIPLTDIYVPGVGQLGDGSGWISDLYQAQPCLKPGPSSCGPIEGWNLHPYGLPNSSAEGIGSVPGLRSPMLSGQNNVIVSEIGFCARDVNGGRDCNQNRSDVVGSSAQAARWLAETLHEALAMHRAGWLKALLLWNRAGDGWAMQKDDGSLTAQGQVLARFASSSNGRG